MIKSAKLTKSCLSFVFIKVMNVSFDSLSTQILLSFKIPVL